MKLLDVNAWLAAGWANHSHHAVVSHWLDREEDDLVFCRVSQLAFLRLVSNPAVTGPYVLTRREAWAALETLAADVRVRFFQEPDGIEALWMALSRRDDRSHRLWTDDYLAAFARAAGATLVTLDAGFESRYPSVSVLTLHS